MHHNHCRGISPTHEPSVRTGGRGDAPPSTDVTTPTPDPAKTDAPSPIELEASDLEVKTPEESIAEQESVAEAVPAVVTMLQAEVDEPMSLLETAQEIAENTNVVVLDESGEPLPRRKLEPLRAHSRAYFGG